MNIQVEDEIIDLLSMSEEPLYSTFRHVEKAFDTRVSLEEFLAIIRQMMDTDFVQLWEWDFEANRPIRLVSIPENLAMQYHATGHEDPRFDPFALSLTLGPNASDRTSTPPWTIDIDFEHQTFVVHGPRAVHSDALSAIERLLPDVSLVPVNSDETRVTGTVERIGR
jgi:hypothetical protein